MKSLIILFLISLVLFVLSIVVVKTLYYKEYTREGLKIIKVRPKITRGDVLLGFIMLFLPIFNIICHFFNLIILIFCNEGFNNGLVRDGYHKYYINLGLKEKFENWCKKPLL